MKVAEKTRDIRLVNVELEKQNFQLEQFAFMAAHNLRSPVARIIGLTDILTNYSARGNPVDHQVVEMIRMSSLDLDDVIRDLISVVQIKSSAPGARQRLNVSHLLSTVLHNFSSDIKANKISIDNQVETDLEFEVDPPLTNAVFTSIVNNSIKYRHEGRVNFISFRAKRKSDGIELQIADNGIGFDSELYRGRIFKPFSRFDPHRSGKGLGLYLAKTQLESMGGEISVTSRPGKGTFVTLKFLNVP
jgi:signal transduction histidine kinase